MILNAAFSEFSKNGYKKTSAADIASAAGISKAMLFYYFGNKKSMYLYMADFCHKIIINKINASVNGKVTDFFDKIKLSSEIKMSMIVHYPAMLLFMKSMYFEKEAEVFEDIKLKFAGLDFYREAFIADDTDAFKFKDGIDARLILKFILLAAEGFSNGLSAENSNDDLTEFAEEFYKFLNIMKNNFYKREYLE